VRHFFLGHLVQLVPFRQMLLQVFGGVVAAAN
jgi:hypothetical protein